MDAEIQRLLGLLVRNKAVVVSGGVRKNGVVGEGGNMLASPGKGIGSEKSSILGPKPQFCIINPLISILCMLRRLKWVRNMKK
jgi:hypothetical protein